VRRQVSVQTRCVHSYSTLALLVLAAFSAGFVDAIAGGGGLISVPALLASGLPLHQALGTNKGQAVFGATASFTTFYRKGALSKPRLLPAFVCAFVGSLLGARLLLFLPSAPLKPLVLVLLSCVLAYVMWPRKAVTADAQAPPPAGTLALAPLHWVALIALCMGAYDGFFGPGTGSILIALYMRIFGDDEKMASGNAKVANLASNLAAVLMFAWRGQVLWAISLPMAAANGLGATLGARAAVAASPKLVRRVLVLVVTALIAKIAYEVLAK
jgi:uncharacterized protein